MNIIILDDYQDAVRKLPCAAKLEPYPAKVYTNTVKGIGQLSVRLRDADAIVLIRERTQITRQLIEKTARNRTGVVGVIGTAVIGHRMQCGRANPRLDGNSAVQHAMNQTEQLARQQQRQQGREERLHAADEIPDVHAMLVLDLLEGTRGRPADLAEAGMQSLEFQIGRAHV